MTSHTERDPRGLVEVLEHVADAFYVLDEEWRFVYVNPAAASLWNRKRDRLIGEKFGDEFPEAVGSESYEAIRKAMEGREVVGFEAISPVTGGWIAGRAYPVPEGIAVIFWDVTARKKEEGERERLLERQRRIVRAFQKALLPPTLPEVPGAELAARYVAASEGLEVGGDFYDVFAVVDDGWGLIAGDVTGKGPEAASLTSLARNVIRTAAMRVGDPREVLGVLNQEILRQTDGNRLITVVYADAMPYKGGPGRIAVRFACAGHPPPLILRGGEVESFSPSGMILGAVPKPRISSYDAILSRGDAVVLYTDGVLEARSPTGEFFGEERFRKLIAGCAGCTAEETAARIEREVLDFQDGEPRDDVAVLVLRVA